MSGHSKFANIKHKKEKNDAAKGKIFTKIGKELAVAVKEGGSADPANNSRLRDVIAKAKANNMPNDTIDKKGQIVVDKEEYETDPDELMMMALDAGAEDFAEEEDSYEILTSPEDFSSVRQAMEDAGVPMAAAQVTMIPQTYVELTDEKDITNIQKTLDMLDDDDDVQDVYHNWDE